MTGPPGTAHHPGIQPPKPGRCTRRCAVIPSSPSARWPLLGPAILGALGLPHGAAASKATTALHTE